MLGPQCFTFTPLSNTLLTLNQDIDCKIKSLPKKFAPIFTTERLILMNNPKNTKQEKTYFNSQLIKAVSP